MLRSIYYYDVCNKFLFAEEIQRIQVFEPAGTIYGPFWIRGVMFIDLLDNARIKFAKHGISDPIYFQDGKVVCPLKDGGKYIFSINSRPVYYPKSGRPRRLPV